MIFEINFLVCFNLGMILLTYLIIKYFKSQRWMENQIRKMQEEVLKLREEEEKYED